MATKKKQREQDRTADLKKRALQSIRASSRTIAYAEANIATATDVAKQYGATEQEIADAATLPTTEPLADAA